MKLGQEYLFQTFQKWSCCFCGGTAEEWWVSWQKLELGPLSENGNSLVFNRFLFINIQIVL